MMRHTGRSSGYARAAALAAALVLALPPPLWAAAPDTLRAGQAAGTAVGLEELPTALGHESSELVHTELSGDWRDTLRHLVRVGEGRRTLLPGQAARIPRSALDMLPDRSLVIELADQRHRLIITSTDRGLVVAADPSVLSEPVMLVPDQPWVAGRTREPGARRIVFPPDQPDGRGVVSRDHLEIRLVRDGDDRVTLHLTDLNSSNGTYLLNEQVEALLRDAPPPALRLAPRQPPAIVPTGLPPSPAVAMPLPISLAEWAATTPPVTFNGRHEQFYPLAADTLLLVPLSAWTALDRRWLFVQLGQQSDAVIVEQSPTNQVNILHSFSEARLNEIRVGETIEVGQAPPPLVARALHRQFVLPKHGVSSIVAPRHVEISLGRSGRDSVVRFYPIADTYLRADQVQAMLAVSPAAAGLEEGAGEAVREQFKIMVVTTSADGPLDEVISTPLNDWKTRYEHQPGHEVIVWRASPEDLADIAARESRQRPPDLIVAVAPSDNAMSWAAEVLGARQAHPWLLRAPLHLVTIATSDTHEVLNQQLGALPRGPDDSYVVVPGPDSPMLARYLNGRLNLALDRRRGGLPEGRIFNPNTLEFSILVAAMAVAAAPDAPQALFGDDPQPLVVHQHGGALAYRMLKALGEPVGTTTSPPEGEPQQSDIWRLENAVRRRLLAMGAAELAELRGGLARMFADPSGGDKVPLAWVQAATFAANEVGRLEIRAQALAFLRGFLNAQAAVWSELSRSRPAAPQVTGAIAGLQSPYVCDMTMVKVNDGGAALEFSISAKGRELAPLEQAVFQRYGVRLELRPVSGSPSSTVPQRFVGHDRTVRVRFTLMKELTLNWDEAMAAIANDRPRLIITGPGLPTESGLEEDTVEQTTREQADTTLNQYY